MKTSIHRIAGFGVWSVSFLALSLAVTRKGGPQTIEAQVQALPYPAKTYAIEGPTTTPDGTKPCERHTRLLLRSEAPLDALRSHFARHPVRDGGKKLAPTVLPTSAVSGLDPSWAKYHDDRTAYVVDYAAPGGDGCRS